MAEHESHTTTKLPNDDGLSRPKKRPLACRLGFHRYSTIGSNGWDALLERCSRCPNYKIVNVILDKELWYGDGLPSWATKRLDAAEVPTNDKEVGK